MTLQEEILIHHVARVCHEANREFCQVLGDWSQSSWEMAEEWQRDSAIKGVRFAFNELRDGHRLQPHTQHEAWMNDKVANGWKYGPVKEHPCMVAYSALPQSQRAKDRIFIGICQALLLGSDA